MAMEERNPAKITLLLQQMRSGNRGAADRVAEVLYPELRRLAYGQFRKERAARDLLQPTALVHEAYLRLVAQEHQNWQNRSHFFGAAARTMRRVLVDYARARNAQKRESELNAVPFDETLAISAEKPVQLLALDEALTRLEAMSPRQARVVELRYFAGLNLKDTAAALGVTPRTVDRDWNVARAWLRRELRP
jgi:RNA polymerase sigma-70 factor, ECF subfamily